MVRSIPEKTLEHWSSMHLSYAFKAHLKLWWPAVGADIEVASLPTSPSKRFWMEIKSTEWNQAGRVHQLPIRLSQLVNYATARKNPTGIPDFYAFPTPPWEGVIGGLPRPTWLAGQDPSDLGYQSKSDEQYFARWFYVVPGHALRVGLAPEIAAFQAGTGPNTLHVASIKAGVLTWTAPGLIRVPKLSWRSFWKKQRTCGDPVWNSQLIVPAFPSRRRTRSRQELRSQLRDYDPDTNANDSVEVFAPIGDDQYRRVTKQ